jgi:hypothetical protein
MSHPQPPPDASSAARPARPVWLLPVIMAIVTGVIGMVLVAGQGLYWMIAVIAAVDALGVFTIIRSARINARNQEARALEIQNQEIPNRP